MRWLSFLVVLGAASVAQADEPVRIELYTMGPGDEAFEAFGHSTLCSFTSEYPNGTCFNYGTTDFTDPVKLTLDVLRGRADFWVGRMPLPLMLRAYEEDDRTIYRQQLELPPGAAEEIAARLEHDMLPEYNRYRYNHYFDNCSTRLRDHIDIASQGMLRRGTEREVPETFRELTQRGFAYDVFMLAGMEVLVGRRVDRHPTVWEAMFLPDVLRAEVARRFHAQPEVLHTRKGPVVSHDLGDGRTVVFALAGALTLLVLLTSLLPWRWPWRLSLATAGLVIGLCAVLADAMAAVALLPELRQNEVLLVLLPTDLLLGFLRPRALFIYLAARAVLLVAVAVGLLAGLLVQPMWAAWALAAGPIIVGMLRASRL